MNLKLPQTLIKSLREEKRREEKRREEKISVQLFLKNSVYIYKQSVLIEKYKNERILS